MQLTSIEREFFEGAVVSARRLLGEPFTEREVLEYAWSEGYELHLSFDPRFVRVSTRPGQRPLWTIDEDPERLQRVYFNEFFCALATFVEREKSLASMRADAIAKEQAMDIQLKRAGKQQPVSEIYAQQLMASGWTW